jgi:hypothetical protein
MQANSCLDCGLATWKRTPGGKLHPDGTGICQWKMPETWVIPKSRYYIGAFGESVPGPSGGALDRKAPHTDCPCWTPASGTQ